MALLQRSVVSSHLEVAAARHVVIMCRSTETNGYTFYRALEMLALDSSTHSLALSASDLIKEPFFGRNTPRVSREATDPLDMVYALFGMSLDDYSSASICLVSVNTISNGFEMAVAIETKAEVVGIVVDVYSSDSRRHITVGRADMLSSLVGPSYE
ncbi:hypothetical protein B0H67DRAFT_649836 [Lasiosphaeris hirsuta]|uniref:Uncharacterized protein n=1 Tax=Lasiosphaeris hirsuta TaxID=260670 RepID=A0AA40DJ45_9PEZI|nr:hypothetical protein B0H67DRAFT_649836 [Lasiosphaeris hirsuta]